MIAIDIETKGKNYLEPDTRILCVGAYGEGYNQTFDFDNPMQVEACKAMLMNTSPKVFHNGMFDLPWLMIRYGFEVNGTLHDTMTRAALIDEYQPLNLDDCCKRLGIKGKNKSETIEAWYDNWQQGMKEKAKLLRKHADQLTDEEIVVLTEGNYKKKIWDNVMSVWNDETGRELMKKYNLQDCVATHELFNAQERFMEPLKEVYAMECKLTRILIRMKKLGIRYDEVNAAKLTERVNDACRKSEQKLIDMYGIDGDTIASGKKLGERMNAMGIHSPVTTPKGAESWSADAINRIHHPVVPLIEEYKSYVAIRDKYLTGALSSSVYNGRIHCTFLPMLRDQESGGGGTVTGRFSCKEPNLQQIPARNKGRGTDFSQDMRSLFLPEEGKMLAALDYSQIEAVLLGHFAKGNQADWFREQLCAGADLHNIVMDMTGITYRPVVKTFNYGCIYGMGWKTAMVKNFNLFEKLAAEKNEDVETFTKQLYQEYHTKFPVIKDTMEWCQNVAKAQGYIDTMGGRRLHKPKAKYDPSTGKINDFIYKMLNKLIQGTAADILKTALIQADEAGLYNVLDLHLLVHDEQVVSVPFNKEGCEAVQELQRIMAGVYKDQMLVPIKSACELGPNWGYWSDDIYEEMKQGIFNPTAFNKDYRETH